MKKHKHEIMGWAIFATVMLGIGLIFSTPAIIHFSTQEQIEFTVKRQEVFYQDEKTKYLIFTDKEVFENTDSLFAWKFDSSDLQSQLEAGKRCKAVVTGIRIPFLSSCRNILEANCQ